jgi:hypothetical protein
MVQKCLGFLTDLLAGGCGCGCVPIPLLIRASVMIVGVVVLVVAGVVAGCRLVRKWG